MSTTIRDAPKSLQVHWADYLWDQMSLSEISERTGIPLGTLKTWSHAGKISTDANHHRGEGPIYPQEVIDRTEALAQVFPLSTVVDFVEPCAATIQRWKRSGVIDAPDPTPPRRDQTRLQMAHASILRDEGLSPAEIGEELDVTEKTAIRLLGRYDNRSHR